MRIPILFGAILVLLSLSCTPPQPFHTLSGQWHLYAYKSTPEANLSLQPDHLPQPVVADFDDRGRRGKFRIETATNAIWGKYRLDEYGSLSFIEIEGTLFGDNKWSQDVWPALQETSAYSFSDQRDTLKMAYGDQGSLFWVKP